MRLRNFLIVLRTPYKREMLQMMQSGKAFLRLHFLCAAFESGLLAALRAPQSASELGQSLPVQRPEMLRALLDLGQSLNEFSLRGGRYHLRGRLSRTLATPEGDPLAAAVQAYATYYNSVYRHAAGRLRGEALGDYLARIGEVVARFSVLTEPYLRSFIHTAVKGAGPLRVLDVGCGSGVALHSAWQANPQVTGVGLDLDPQVAAQAQGNLRAWGLQDRFQVLGGDIRRPPAGLSGPFELIILFNLIYYFPLAERTGLLASLLRLLAPRGALLLASNFRGLGRDCWAANLDLAVNSMLGCAPLPELDVLRAQLAQAGYQVVRTERLMSGGEFYGIEARPRPDPVAAV